MEHKHEGSCGFQCRNPNQKLNYGRLHMDTCFLMDKKVRVPAMFRQIPIRIQNPIVKHVQVIQQILIEAFKYRRRHILDIFNKTRSKIVFK